MGKRKQSVTDVERLFGPEVVEFMKRKGYHEEAKYVSVVLNWRLASDERGLTGTTRTKYNSAFLDYILEELMPWHKDSDFSQLEVNQ